MGEIQAAARTLVLEVITLEIRRAEDIGPAFEVAKGRADALYVAADPLANNNRVRINTLALAGRLPTMQGVREYVEAGGLMSYGPNLADGYRRAADYVDKILRGAKPGDIPVEQPTKFDLVINLTTAKALGLTIPESFLLRVDEVIDAPSGRFTQCVWFGLGAPKGTPAGVIDKLNQETNAALTDPKIKARIAESGGTVLPGSPADFGKLIAEETEKWSKVVRAATIKPES